MYSKAFMEAIEELERNEKRKKQQKVMRVFGFFLLLVLSFGVGLSSYLAYPAVKDLVKSKSFLTFSSSKPLENGKVISAATQIASEIQTPEKITSVLSCPVNFNFFEASFFSLCYPSLLNQIYQKPEAVSGDLKEVIFSNDDEELVVSFDDSRSPNLHICNVSKPVEIGGFSATRTALKMEDVAGCDKIKGYVTKIKYSDDKSLYLKMMKLNGYFENEQDFVLVERSLKLH